LVINGFDGLANNKKAPATAGALQLAMLPGLRALKLLPVYL